MAVAGVFLLLFILVGWWCFSRQENHSLAPLTVADVSNFAPSGWSLIASTTSDFNGDGFADIAEVMESTTDPISSNPAYEDIYPRRLIILFGGKGGYTFATSSDKAILLNGDGGSAIGDPFGDGSGSLEAEGNLLKINYYGGSAWRWADTYTFACEGKRWHLIHYKSLSYYSPDPEGENSCTYDVDLVVGKKISVCGENEKEEREDFIPLKPVYLDTFDVHDFDLGVSL